ncbi:MAG: hypothetical protein ABEJ36_01075 [Candidatus Nanosalina sp.]
MDIVKESLVRAAAITAGILILGALIGLQMDDARTSYLEEQLKESSLRSDTFLVTQQYLEKSSQNYCKLVENQVPEIAQQNARIGRDLQSFSGSSLGSQKDFDYLKKRYYVNQLRLYNMLQTYRERCNSDVSLIFFFFDSSVASKRQGAVLTEYRRTVDNRTYVFSYNLNTEKSTVLEMLKTDYNVTEGPTIVINGEKTFRRYVSLKELKQVIG